MKNLFQGPFVAAFASTNLGDVSPNTKGPKCSISGENCSMHYTCPGIKEQCFASGPGKDMFESTKIIANTIMEGAWVSPTFPNVFILYHETQSCVECRVSELCKCAEVPTKSIPELRC